jgi:hypothetical protein
MLRSPITVGAAISLSLSVSAGVSASLIVTQTLDRAYFSTWLLNPVAQQSFAHALILEEADASAVPVFDDKSLAGAEIVYISPSLDELTLAASEIDALEKFVVAGGRLIVAGDYGVWAEDMGPLAARFDVTYGGGFLDGVFAGVVLVPTNPLFDGPAGVVTDFNCASPNDALTSTNPDFVVAAEWSVGPTAIGYLPVGAGEVVFLTDFNTFDDDLLILHDNRILWSNLFGLSAIACPEDIDGSDAIDFGDLLAILAAWGECEEGGPCLEDLNRNGFVDFLDILIVLGGWGPCP